MSDKRVTDLTAYTTPVNTDVFPVVDVVSEATKKITLANLRTAVSPFVTVGFSDADYICDGTDDEVQIQAALTAVGDAGGGVVHVKASSTPYSLGQFLWMPNYVTLEGDGWNTLLQLADGAWAANIGSVIFPIGMINLATGRLKTPPYTTTYGVMIKDLKVDANRAGQTGLTKNHLYGVHMQWVNNARLENLFVINAHSSGIGVWPSNPTPTVPSEVVVTGCRLEDNGSPTNGQAIDSGIFVSNGTSLPVRVIVSNCVAVSNGNGFCAEDSNGGIQFNNLIGCDNVRDGVYFSNGAGVVNGGYFYDNGHAGIGTDLNLGGRRIALNGVQCRENEYGLYAYSTHGMTVNGGHFWWNDEAGIYLDAYACNIVGAKIEGNGCGDDPTYPYGIYIKANGQGLNLVSGCNFSTDWGSWKGDKDSQKWGIFESGGCISYYFGNIIPTGNYGCADGAITFGAGSVSKARNNIGYPGAGQTGHVTENSGTGSIVNGQTTDVITHGLAVTPTVDDIAITLAENPTNTPGAIWVDTIGATTFKVNCENDPGATGLDFGWKAIVL